MTTTPQTAPAALIAARDIAAGHLANMERIHGQNSQLTLLARVNLQQREAQLAEVTR